MPSGEVYLIDTCVWVHFAEHGDLGSVLSQMAVHARYKDIKTLDVVMKELKSKFPEVYKLVRKHPFKVGAAVEYDSRVVPLSGSILAAHRSLGRALTPVEPADPWLIAVAKVNGWTVVTDDGTGRRPSQKLMGVCKTRSVSCVDRLEFARRLGIKL